MCSFQNAVTFLFVGHWPCISHWAITLLSKRHTFVLVFCSVDTNLTKVTFDKLAFKAGYQPMHEQRNICKLCVLCNWGVHLFSVLLHIWYGNQFCICRVKLKTYGITNGYWAGRGMERWMLKDGKEHLILYCDVSTAFSNDKVKIICFLSIFSS